MVNSNRLATAPAWLTAVRWSQQWVLLPLLLMLWGMSSMVDAAAIKDVRLWRAPDNTRLVFDLDAPVEHSILTLSNPSRLVIDVQNSALKTDLNKVDLKQSPIRRLRSGVHNKSDLRVVLDLKAAVKPRSFLLKANAQKGDRLVVDLYDHAQSEARVTKALKKIEQADQQRRDIIVAIDAGHGGEDPGAIGPRNVREKHVVLKIARELEKMLKNKRGYQPVMVRSGDYYLSLPKRRDIARQKNADLFVSIHADAFKDHRARGSSVYVLSQRGATSTTAKFLAASENAADQIGGVPLTDKDSLLAEVLVDLSMTYKMSASTDVGKQVLGQMGRISRLHSKHVEKAAFAVLKTPDIPSILVESGFISNPTEAKQLNTRAYQNKMARAIYQGINYYFEQQPPDGTYVAWLKKRQEGLTHVVSYGDTLSEIASRYRVSVAALLSHNGLSNSKIRVGQKILIPAS